MEKKAGKFARFWMKNTKSRFKDHRGIYFMVVYSVGGSGWGFVSVASLEAIYTLCLIVRESPIFKIGVKMEFFRPKKAVFKKWRFKFVILILWWWKRRRLRLW
jgi:hypothetical protein